MKKMAKSYSATRCVAFMYGFTMLGAAKFFIGFSAPKVINPAENEIYMRLNSIFAKNKYGYTTSFMSDFDLLLDGVLNERFIDESTLYYDNEQVTPEIEDMEVGLNGEFSEEDIKGLVKDTHAHGAEFKSLRYPGRVGTNYAKSDALSVYKTHPAGSKPAF